MRGCQRDFPLIGLYEYSLDFMPSEQKQYLKSLLYLGPVILTVVMILWMLAVSPYVTGEDEWATYPVFFLIFVLIGYHGFLMAVDRRRRYLLMGYGILHMLFFFYFWILALTIISKDSL
jgi:hypothetical protein